MSVINTKIQERLKKIKDVPKKQFAISIKAEHIEQLDTIAKALSLSSGRSTTRTMLIEDAIEGYIVEAISTLEANGIEFESSELPNEENYDTAIFPARAVGFKQAFINESKWYYVRIKEGRIPLIKYIAIYVGTPISKITHYARVAENGFVFDEHEKKYIVKFMGQAIELENPIPLGTISPAATRSPRYTTLQRLLTAEEYKDL